jgi:hypothetical protein
VWSIMSPRDVAASRFIQFLCDGIFRQVPVFEN